MIPSHQYVTGNCLVARYPQKFIEHILINNILKIHNDNIGYLWLFSYSNYFFFEKKFSVDNWNFNLFYKGPS